MVITKKDDLDNINESHNIKINYMLNKCYFQKDLNHKQ